MTTDSEEFINCAMNAFEDGKNAQEIEEECVCGSALQTQKTNNETNKK